MNNKFNSKKGLEKATFILGIIALSFAIVTFFVVLSALVTKFIIAMHEKVKIGRTKEAMAKARKYKNHKERIRHILKQRKIARSESKKTCKENKNQNECDEDVISDIIDSTGNDEDLEDFIQDLDNLLIEEE